jgi:hypothetical protein
MPEQGDKRPGARAAPGGASSRADGPKAALDAQGAPEARQDAARRLAWQADGLKAALDAPGGPPEPLKRRVG